MSQYYTGFNNAAAPRASNCIAAPGDAPALAHPASGRAAVGRCAMNHKPPNKPRYGRGWKESSRKPLGKAVRKAETRLADESRLLAKSVGLSGRMIDIV